MPGIKPVVLVALTAIGLALLGCSSPAPTNMAMPAPTNTPPPSPTKTPAPVPTSTPTPRPLELTVLHTNDTLGFTEPCG